jgi:hypothetical protein
MADPPPYPGTPRWVKVSGIVVGLMVLLAVILLHAGGGPRHNIPFAGGLGGHTAPDGGH